MGSITIYARNHFKNSEDREDSTLHVTSHLRIKARKVLFY